MTGRNIIFRTLDTHHLRVGSILGLIVLAAMSAA
jgi:hypothetical protein